MGAASSSKEAGRENLEEAGRENLEGAASSSNKRRIGRENLEEVPAIFLSHSGEQKTFVERLYLELRHAGHDPFFDKDANISLPKGHQYPPRILQACQFCQMGIIVLSHMYIESLWPMLELQHLAFHDHSHPGPRSLYPVFYDISPGDLFDPDNLKRWQQKWDSMAPTWNSKVQKLQECISSQDPQFHIHMNVNSWPKALERLAVQSGDVRSNYPDDDAAFVKAVVSHVCFTLPPPQHYHLSNDIKGTDHMQTYIDGIFQQQISEANGVTMLGVHGIGGSGKSTLCQNMANFYNKDFPGRSCWLELPSNIQGSSPNNIQGSSPNSNLSRLQLLQAIKAVLPTVIGEEDKVECSNVEAALARLQVGLQRHKVFLALDNVWDSSPGNYDTARSIISMNYVLGSKLMVTSRSKRVLQGLLECPKEMTGRSIAPLKVVHVPSITEAEATEALIFSIRSYSKYIPLESFRSLARSCFFENQCHPLFLNFIGAQLRREGGPSYSAQDWKDLISRLITHYGSRLKEGEYEDSILKILGASFHALPPNLKILFTDLATCMFRRYDISSSFYSSSRFDYSQSISLLDRCEWLSTLYADKRYTANDIRLHLLELEYYGLLEITEFYDSTRATISIHDLNKCVAEQDLCSDANCRFMFRGPLSSLPIQELKNLKFLDADICREKEVGTLMSNDLSSKLEVLDIKKIRDGPTLSNDPLQLSVQGMKSLRFLYLEGCHGLEKLDGWEGAPNLVQIHVIGANSLHKIGCMGCLFKLEKLSLCGIPELKGLEFRDIFRVGKQGKVVDLNLSANDNLVDVRPIVSNFTSLQRLNLSSCKQLREVPNINCFSNLRTLDLSDCYNLKHIKGTVCSLTALEELYLMASGLESIPDLRNLPKLRTLEAARHLDHLGHVRLGEFALTSLKSLTFENCQLEKYGLEDRTSVNALELFGLNGSSRQQPQDINSWLKSYAFLNLKKAHLGIRRYRPNLITLLDVSGLASVEDLSLVYFTSLQEISGLDHLINLKVLGLSHLSSLREINLKGFKYLEQCTFYDLTKLEKFHMPPGSPALQQLYLHHCSALRILKGVRAYNVTLRECPLLDPQVYRNTKIESEDK